MSGNGMAGSMKGMGMTMDDNLQANMDEYLPLRDVVFKTLRQGCNNLDYVLLTELSNGASQTGQPGFLKVTKVI